MSSVIPWSFVYSVCQLDYAYFIVSEGLVDSGHHVVYSPVQESPHLGNRVMKAFITSALFPKILSRWSISRGAR